MPQNTVNGFTSDRFEAVREVFDKRSCVKYVMFQIQRRSDASHVDLNF